MLLLKQTQVNRGQTYCWGLSVMKVK